MCCAGAGVGALWIRARVLCGCVCTTHAGRSVHRYAASANAMRLRVYMLRVWVHCGYVHGCTACTHDLRVWVRCGYVHGCSAGAYALRMQVAPSTGTLRVRMQCGCGFICCGCGCTVDMYMGALRVRMFCGVDALWIGTRVLCGLRVRCACGCGCAVDTCTGALACRICRICRIRVCFEIKI